MQKITDLKSYFETIPDGARIYSFLSSINEDTPLGKHTISDRIFVNLQTFETRDGFDGEYECHRDYADVHVLIRGHERIHYTDYAETVVTQPYEKARDVEFLSGTKDATVDYGPMQGIVFDVNEPHMPSRRIDKPETVLKAVVKIRKYTCRKREVTMENKGMLSLTNLKLSRTAESTEQKVVSFLIREQYLDRALWKKFVNQFRERIDGDTCGWRGEFWGKSLRGAAMIFASCPDDALYDAMTETVRDMLTAADETGRVTTYRGENEYRIWDLWCRKYVMLGMEYYYEICRDDALRKEIVSFLTGCADDILSHVGKEEGKIPITSSNRWKGVNSSSILEPMVKLYRLTGEARFLAFSEYIVSEGGAEGIDLFRLAREDRLLPYQYGVTKAYEIMSCFEGLYELYLVTGNPDYRDSIVRFGEAVRKSEVTVIGSIGLTHELFDHGAVRQTAPHDDVLQETCVTVTWMKLLSRMLKLTGDPKYADEIEKSYYNAYLGAVNFEKKESPYMYEKFVKKYGCPVLKNCFLPFDSYSPITPMKRGTKVGGDQLFSDGTYYGCCASIGGAGVGTFLRDAVLTDGGSIRVVFYQNGTYRIPWKASEVVLTIRTDYPAENTVSVTVQSDGSETLPLFFRLPGWCSSYCVDGTIGKATVRNGWIEINCHEKCESITLAFQMALAVERPAVWTEDTILSQKVLTGAVPVTIRQSPDELRYFAVKRGPIVFALDEAICSNIDDRFDPDFDSAVVVRENPDQKPAFNPMVELKMNQKSGSPLTLVDYASAGRTWESRITAWLKTKE